MENKQDEDDPEKKDEDQVDQEDEEDEEEYDESYVPPSKPLVETIKSKVVPAWEARIRSPIYFGRSLTSWTEQRKKESLEGYALKINNNLFITLLYYY